MAVPYEQGVHDRKKHEDYWEEKLKPHDRETRDRVVAVYESLRYKLSASTHDERLEAALRIVIDGPGSRRWPDED